MRVALPLRWRWILSPVLALSGLLVAEPNFVEGAEGADGTDFIEDLRIVYRIATCGGGGASVPVAIPRNSPGRTAVR